jgi:hypothetical protein
MPSGSAVGVCGGQDGVAVGWELGGELFEKVRAARVVECLDAEPHLACERGAGGLAGPLEQLSAQRGEITLAPLVAGQVEQVAAAIGDRVPQPLEPARRHIAGPIR